MGALRQKATGFRRSEEAHSQEEGQDHQEDRVAYGVLQVQEEDPVPHQEDQALRVGWRQEEEGTDDPVLNWNEDSSLFFLYSTLKRSFCSIWEEKYIVINY